MKNKISNSLLKALGSRIAGFTMSSAIERLKKHKIEIKSVIDIGASDGKWSIKAMKSFPGASFLAIEPLRERKENLEYLKKAYANLDYVICVAGGEDGRQVTINVAANLDGSTVNGSGGAPRQVPVRTIDAILAEKQLAAPFLLKFDTHGYEIPILLGAKNTLKTPISLLWKHIISTLPNRLSGFRKCVCTWKSLDFAAMT